MKIVKLVSLVFALSLVSITAQAQFGKKLGNAVQKSAENATVKKAEQKTEQAVNKSIDKATDPNTYKNDENNNAPANPPQQQQADTPSNSSNTNTVPNASPAQSPQDPVKSAEMTYAKSDFVAGDEIIFEDLLIGEKLGEFPSMWDLLGGNAEIAKVNGENAILFVQGTEITPLMKTPKNYLSESYTVEFDFYRLCAHFQSCAKRRTPHQTF